MAPKYLYAAAVQGIQDFIFQTNKLQEIAGASELVEQICTKKFREAFPANKYKDSQLLIGAAGNIKYLFNEDEKDICAQIFRNFPFQVAQLASGITISQTVVEILDTEEINSSHIGKAEQQLKVQRNLPTRPLMGLMIAKKTPKTGKPAVKKESGELLDKASEQKIDFYDKGQISLLKKIVPDTQQENTKLDSTGQKMSKDDNSWLAVIHADGNDLGKLIPTFFSEEIKGDKFVRLQKTMSDLLNDCTINAAKKAFEEVINSPEDKKLHKTTVPIRPIVCGGDDLTIIIQAPLAIEFTKTFLQKFTEETTTNFVEWAKDIGTEKLQKGLTACAGIAFVKEKYPFHYAVELADDLCKHAKKEAQKVKEEEKTTPACFSFYKIESAFVRSFEEIQKYELVSSINIGDKNLSLSNCPYYIESNEKAKNSAKKLACWLTAAKNSPAVRSRLRQILSMLNTETNIEIIKLELRRIKTLYPKDFNSFDIDPENIDLTSLAHLHDFLSLHSIS